MFIIALYAYWCSVHFVNNLVFNSQLAWAWSFLDKYFESSDYGSGAFPPTINPMK